MGEKTSTGCYRELGAELRKIREAAGLTEVELSQTLGWSTTRISRGERGYIHLSVVDVILYLAFCGVYGTYGSDLHAMCREAEPKPGYWLRRHEAGLPDATRTLIYHESTASASTSYEPELVPGLLQTEAYIRALTVKRWPSWDPEFAVRIRKERQRILHRPVPGRFTFFVHENALRLAVGDAAIMHEQLLALLLLDGLPHVAIRIVPASAGAQAMFGGSFRLLEYPNHKPLVYLEGVNCGLFLEDREPHRRLCRGGIRHCRVGAGFQERRRTGADLRHAGLGGLDGYMPRAWTPPSTQTIEPVVAGSQSDSRAQIDFATGVA